MTRAASTRTVDSVTTPVLAAATSPAASAAAAAQAAANLAGVDVRALERPAELDQAEQVLRDIWRTPQGDAPVHAHLMRAIGFTGGYVYGAYARDNGALLGVSVGFLTLGEPLALHSHISGIATGAQGRGLGFALKQHQRAWSLDHGISTATWTFDPLVRRNAFFNLAKLGARVEAYLPDFYGAMTDGLNAGDASDRFYVTWRLDDDAAELASRGQPVEPAAWRDGAEIVNVLSVDADGGPRVHGGSGTVLGCAIPPDIETLRRSAPGLARQWRFALRDVLVSALADGYVVQGVSRDGSYVLARVDVS